ncbi:MAG: hypothetical protein ACRCZ2_12620 [Fusobacteriaceae bacterium]
MMKFEDWVIKYPSDAKLETQQKEYAVFIILLKYVWNNSPSAYALNEKDFVITARRWVKTNLAMRFPSARAVFQAGAIVTFTRINRCECKQPLVGCLDECTNCGNSIYRNRKFSLNGQNELVQYCAHNRQGCEWRPISTKNFIW